MKSRIISIIFLLTSFLILALWFEFNYKSRQLEKEIKEVQYSINLSIERNNVLLSEYAAHTNPLYLEYLASIYLDYENKNNEKTVVYSEANFLNQVNKFNSIISVATEKNLSIVSQNYSN